MATRSPVKYTVEMDVKAFFVVVSLLVLAGFVVFYLGMSFGKAMRVPINEGIAQLETDQAKVVEEGKSVQQVKEDLEIYDVKEDSSTSSKVVSPEKSRLDKLRKEYASILKGNSNSNKTVPSEKSRKEVSSSSKTSTYYTVQVLATGDKDKAKKFIQSLKKQKYEAYLQKVKAPGTSDYLYRVRVGKLATKEGAKKVYQSLAKIMKGNSKPQIIQTSE